MQSWKRTMWILWFGVLLCSSSYTMSVPFLPLFLFDLGVKESSVNLWAGIVHSSAFLVGAVMAPLWGMLADKYGKRKMVIRAGLSLAIIYALISFVQTPWQLVGVRMLHGFVGGFVPASMSIVASVAPKEKLGWSLGMMQAGTMTGGILGPLFGGLLAEAFGLRRSFVVAGIIIAAATIAVMIWVKEGKAEQADGATTGKKQAEPVTYRMAFRNRALLSMLLLLATFQLSVNMIQPLITLHIAKLQGGLQGAELSAGFVLSLIGIAGILASPIWGRLGERKGYYRILVFCLLSAGLVVSMQFFVQGLWLFAIVQFIFGLFMAGIAPSVNTLVVQSTDEQFRGRSFGLTTSANQFGSMLGPLIGGLLGLAVGIHWIFVATGMIMFAAGISVWLMRKRELGQAKTGLRGL
ncbi:MFS transporter [Paenibacillus sp. FSL H8-0548]|uniref:MFS transporter n=1 Tax=Paenibacillus sp. FSL H8-0548 TaxID=1920422 RepID=UPI00096F3D45|nr:MFS transporter [Paenibacillus sp. FSL H8-0548]OMF22715.1 MFS transporter [Paenibacillus sp. FSL H8-0548]